jgi:hypothetical protein
LSTSESWRNPRPAPELAAPFAISRLASRLVARSALGRDDVRPFHRFFFFAAYQPHHRANSSLVPSRHQRGISRLHSPHNSQVRAFYGILHFPFASLSRAARNPPWMAIGAGRACLVHRRRLLRTRRNPPILRSFPRRQPLGFASGFRKRPRRGRDGLPLLPLAPFHQ